jgi:hypothetical protein
MSKAPALDALRYELKLTCAAHYLAQARAWIRLHPEVFRVAYAPRTVHNLYLDTPELNSFNANRAGMPDRQKLRLRWYGEQGVGGDKRNKRSLVAEPVLELKYKMNLLGGKQQQALACELDWQRPYSELLATVKKAAGPQWQQWLTTATQPTLINYYQREYYITVDGAIRATLDYAQVIFDQRLQPYPNLSRPIPLTDFVVIELKATPEHIERLQEAVGRFPIPRSRNSKYVKGILAGIGCKRAANPPNKIIRTV